MCIRDSATFEDGKSSLLVVATDDARDRGVRADAVIKELAQLAGGRGGGKPHMAQAGGPPPARTPGDPRAAHGPGGGPPPRPLPHSRRPAGSAREPPGARRPML